MDDLEFGGKCCSCMTCPDPQTAPARTHHCKSLLGVLLSSPKAAVTRGPMLTSCCMEHKNILKCCAELGFLKHHGGKPISINNIPREGKF